MPMTTLHQHDRSDLGVLGDAIRRRRRRLGLSQQEVADLAGCSERTVRAVEHGKATVRLDVLQQVMATVGLAFTLGQGNGEIVVPDEHRGVR